MRLVDWSFWRRLWSENRERNIREVRYINIVVEEDTSDKRDTRVRSWGAVMLSGPAASRKSRPSIINAGRPLISASALRIDWIIWSIHGFCIDNVTVL